MSVSTLDLPRALKETLGLRGDFDAQLLEQIMLTVQVGDLNGAVGQLGIPWATYQAVSAAGAGLRRGFVFSPPAMTTLRIDLVVQMSSQAIDYRIGGIDRIVNVNIPTLDSGRWNGDPLFTIGAATPLILGGTVDYSNANWGNRGALFWRTAAADDEMRGPIWLREARSTVSGHGPAVAIITAADNTAFEFCAKGVLFPAP